jgi:hypothetical protein
LLLQISPPPNGKIANGLALETKCGKVSQASDVFSLGKIFWLICNKNICDPALDQLLDIGIFFKDSQHSRGAALFYVFQLLIGMLSQSVNEQLNNFRQSIVQAIFMYVQKTYNAPSNDKSSSEGIINNIQTLLIILKESSFNEQKLKNEIVNWRKNLERGSDLYRLVSEAAGLKSNNLIQNLKLFPLFWKKPPSAPSTEEQRSICKPF